MSKNMYKVDAYLNPETYQNDEKDLGVFFTSAGVKMSILIPLTDD